MRYDRGDCACARGGLQHRGTGGGCTLMAPYQTPQLSHTLEDNNNNNIILRFTRYARLNTIIKMLRTLYRYIL